MRDIYQNTNWVGGISQKENYKSGVETFNRDDIPDPNMRNLHENVRRADRAKKVLEEVVGKPSSERKVVMPFPRSKMKQIWDQTYECCRILIDLARHRIQQTDSTEEISYKAFGHNLSKYHLLVPTQSQLTVMLPRATLFSSKTQTGGKTQLENSNYRGFLDSPTYTVVLFLLSSYTYFINII